MDTHSNRKQRQPREQQKLATREAIVAAAKELFARQGLLATTTAEIAAAAGVSHGTLFLHFPRREDLQREVIGLVGERIADALHRAAAGGACLADILRHHLEAIAAEESFYRQLVIAAPLLGREARATLIGIQSAVAHHLFESKESSTKHPQQQWSQERRVLVFNTWIGLVHHYIVNADLFAPEKSVVEEWGEKLIAHFVEMAE